MTTITFAPSAARVVTGLSVALAAALLSGCGIGDAGPATAQGVVVPVAVGGAQAAGRPATPKSLPRSDVVGRRFDLGTVVRVEEDWGVPIVVFDRWTARGVADSRLAAKGTPIGVHSDERYQNLNSKITYRIPVAPGAHFTYRHCVAVDQPPQRKTSTLEDFARLRSPETVVLLTLDQHGRVFSAQNDPAC